MAERRSSRSRKSLKYSGFEDLSDDDFADTTPPPPKKSKSGKTDVKDAVANGEKENRQRSIDASVHNSKKDSKTKGKSVTEKVFDRDLEEALQLSLLETGGSQETTENAVSEPPQLWPESIDQQGAGEDGQPPLLSPVITDSMANKGSFEPLMASTGKVVGSTVYGENLPGAPFETSHSEKASTIPGLSVVLDDSIEILESGVEDGKPTGRGETQRSKRAVRQTKKKPMVIDSDEDGDESDFKPDNDSDDDDNDDKDVPSEESDSPSDNGDDSDSDFDGGKKKKAKKKEPPKKRGQATVQKTKAATTEKKSLTNVKSEAQLPAKPAQVLTKHTVPPKAVIPKVSSAAKKATTSPAVRNTSPAVRNTSPAVSNTSAVNRTAMTPTTLKSAWKPPERVNPGNGPSVPSGLKSPTSGLRLGLSRNQRVKPLHPSVKVT